MEGLGEEGEHTHTHTYAYMHRHWRCIRDKYVFDLSQTVKKRKTKKKCKEKKSRKYKKRKKSRKNLGNKITYLTKGSHHRTNLNLNIKVF